MELRSARGWAAVAGRLGIAGPPDPAALLEACRRRVGVEGIAWMAARGPSRARPRARGRWLAGTITLFPRAFADARTLAHTALHELAHARGLDEEAAERLVREVLDGPQPETS